MLVISGFVFACEAPAGPMKEFQPVDGTLTPGFNPNLHGQLPILKLLASFPKPALLSFVIMILQQVFC